MKIHFFYYCLALFCLSCNAQNATITIYNKATVNTDSLYFPHLKRTYEFVVQPGESKSITVDISNQRHIGEGGLYANLYAKNKIFPVIFSRRGLTAFDIDENVTYFFPNATREDDRLPVKPTEFDFFLINHTGKKIDSIKSDAQYRNSNQYTDSLTKVYLKFEEFSKKPEVYVYQNGKKYTIIVEHPWDIWNYHAEMYNFYKDGTAAKDSRYIIGRR